jgi:beta-glucosidase-like glycosyl hydrolase/CubicO group peptidase (beta-lactamase class C family)
MKQLFLMAIAAVFSTTLWAQKGSSLSEKDWVDSVFNSLSPDEKIAQLMVIRAHSNLGADHVAGVEKLIRQYNVGALCFFQGGPLRQANLTNYYQSIAKTPLMVTIDGEFGLGMRLDSVTKFPYQSALGALPDESLVYQMGLAVGEQMKRIGVHVNYAPTIDVNNNPNNPVIGYRSFGEDKIKVARFGVAYVKGMQDAGIMATAKHFPGHGDTEVDSHLDLPVINKSLAQLDSLELYPFKELIKAGVGSIMVAHLFIPAIDNTPNRPTSLSKNAINDLLRDKLKYDGIVFTDALEMKGVTKFFPAGEAAVQALIAGNDMLCLPDDVPAAINAVKNAIDKKRLKWNEIDDKLVKVLRAKYQLGLNNLAPIETKNLVADLNAKTNDIRLMVARNTLTVLRHDNMLFPLTRLGRQKKVAYVGIGASYANAFNQRLKKDLKADVFSFSYSDNDSTAQSIIDTIKSRPYTSVIIGFHDYSLRPANNFNISPSSLRLWNALQTDSTATILFGNVYAAKNFCFAKNVITTYQDDDINEEIAADFLLGRLPAKGKVPVTVCDYPFGAGIAVNNLHSAGFTAPWLAIDSIAYDGIKKGAYPGCVVLAVQDGVIKYHKAFGSFGFDKKWGTVNLETVYDIASVTKTSATTVAVMKLYEQGKLDLNKTLGDYLPYARGTNKQNLLIKDVLLHQAGLSAYISFYKETIDAATGQPSPAYYRSQYEPGFTIPVAQNLYLRDDYNDSMLAKIMKSPLGPKGRYVYSDNDFILLGKIVESITGMHLDQYVQKTFYAPLGMITTGYKPFERLGVEHIAPTEEEKYFRRQLLRGYVHDEGAAMFGNVSGHAGIFSNAYDLSLLYQMLANGGTLSGKRFFKPETIELFSSYGSDISRRGLGFDKPEKDNAKRDDPYPSQFVSPATFGHTGFTGTCVWVDPDKKLVYVFLSNRVYNSRTNNLLQQMNIRGKIQDAIYKAINSEQAEMKMAPLVTQTTLE